MDRSIDDLYIKLRAMSFDEALHLAVELNNSLPLGSTIGYREKIINDELERFGWSYNKLRSFAKAGGNT